ncbi:helix-turn-helix domain-containing protein [Microvirga tunisiensis]|uniref:Helix-turn-helix domain-containing protein n=3 Tax=Pannonibacter tanglangensis TaxID=2750084 RepID=A0ABW9ZHN0_9HYPH|nr:helix-turn-helix domain-containing protein [Pannonibacter sp. XCT-34]NBN77079.1 helix-turn-helix domain-containing protein [Pannonibacter sp. XCT-53]
MTPDQFRDWRRALGLKQKEAAERLGLKKRMIQYYEKGHRDGRPVEIPKSVRLACYALSQGIGDFDGTATTAANLPPRPADGAPASDLD